MSIWISLAILVPLFIVLFTYGNRHKGEKRDVIAVVIYCLAFIGLMIAGNA